MSLDIGKVTIALLGLLAYKNRDKLGELIKGRTSSDPAAPGGEDGVSGGLNDVLDRFRNAGAGDQVDSWVGKGPNQPIQREHAEKAINPEVLEQLSAQTGLSRDELLERITKDLPEAVDEMTPTGQLPADGSAAPGTDRADDLRKTKW